MSGTVTALAVKVFLTIIFAIAHELKGPPAIDPDQISPEQLHDLARLDAINDRMAWYLLALLLASLSLMAALDAPRWVGIGWLVALVAFYVRWTVIVLRYERAILAKPST